MSRWTSVVGFFLFVLLAVPLVAHDAVAHDAVRLSSASPDSVLFHIVPGRALGASWDDVNLVRLGVRTAGRWQRLAGAEQMGREPISWTPSLDRCSMLMADLGPGLDRGRADAWRRATHTSKHLVCPEKQPGPGGHDAWLNARRQVGALVTAKAGSRIEVRPLLNPATLRPDRDLPVRVYRDGAADTDAVVHAEGPDGQQRSARTDDAGIAVVRVSSHGAWRIRYRTRLDDRDVEATLAFEVAPASMWTAAATVGAR